MTSEEIRAKIEELEADIKPIETSIKHALEQYKVSASEAAFDFLTPKLSSELFTDIRKLEATFEEYGYRLLKARTDTTSDLKRIDRAIDTGLLYMDLIISENALSLDELKSIAQENRARVLSLSDAVKEMQASLFNIAWQIYFTTLSSKEILSEIQLISDSFKIIEEDIGADGFISLKEEKSRNIVADIDTPYISGSARYMTTPQYRKLSAPQQREELSKVISPYFDRHIQALSGSRDRFRAKNILARTIDNLLELDKAEPISAPTTFYGFVDKVSRSLPKIPMGEENGTPINIASEKDKKRGVNIPVIVRLGGDNREPIEEYDLEILDTVLTCWENGSAEGKLKSGIVSVTLQEFYRQLKHNSNARIESEDERIDIIYRLMKLSSTIQYLDATQEGEHYKKYAGLEGFSRMGAIISVYVDRQSLNGISTDIIHISNLELSPQYLYSKAKEQITNTPTKYLETRTEGKKGKAKSKTTEKILIERYLRQRIETRRRQGYEIKLETVIEYLGIDLSQYKDPKSKKQSIVRKITDTLTAFTNTGYINGWRCERKGREKYYKFIFEK